MMKVSLKKEYVQPTLCVTILFIDLIIIQTPNLLIRCILSGLLCCSFFIPYIRRFTLPALPIFTWLVTYYAVQFIPNDYRPNHIFVNVLPTLERIIYGTNLSEIISQHTHPILDILAWLPYGVIHFSFPFILSALLFIFGPPGTLKVFASAFGFMNLAGVLTQLFFPNASPWYELIYGSAPANYSIPGEAGGLKRIDEILGLELYGSAFGNSPLVFGAFPSLHSGCACIEMLFMNYLFPRAKPFTIIYVMWMWFATMYLTHHYMIDLVGGSIYALLAFTVAQQFLLFKDPKHRTRLDYLGITKISFKSFLSSIEQDSSSYSHVEKLLPMHHTKQNRPQPIRTDVDIEEEEPVLSPSSDYSSSEPNSPITPHSPISAHFNK